MHINKCMYVFYIYICIYIYATFCEMAAKYVWIKKLCF